jgi:hypothetical protein
MARTSFFMPDRFFERRLHMPFYFKPHTPEWFEALEAFDPIKATVTKIVVETLGNLNVCSVCGDDPAQDYELLDKFMQKNAVATIRLCDDCLKIKMQVHREELSHFGQSASQR